MKTNSYPYCGFDQKKFPNFPFYLVLVLPISVPAFSSVKQHWLWTRDMASLSIPVPGILLIAFRNLAPELGSREVHSPNLKFGWF